MRPSWRLACGRNQRHHLHQSEVFIELRLPVGRRHGQRLIDVIVDHRLELRPAFGLDLFLQVGRKRLDFLLDLANQVPILLVEQLFRLETSCHQLGLEGVNFVEPRIGIEVSAGIGNAHGKQGNDGHDAGDPGNDSLRARTTILHGRELLKVSEREPRQNRA